MDVSGTKVVLAIGALAAALATFALVAQPTVRLRPAKVVTEPLIAVVPFDNLEGDEALEVLASDITVAVTETLARAADLRVVSRGAALEHRDIAGGASGVALELGADYVLAGSVEREGDGLRLQVYFVQPGERPRIWADEFRFDAFQRERIPEAIARTVRAALTDSGAPPEDPPGSP